jgi:predicted  nucleic acid-binding Zn-ribbon protein
MITRTGELAALLQLAALDAQIRQAERTESEVVHHLNGYRVGIAMLARYIDENRARLASSERGEQRLRLAEVIQTKEREVASAAQTLDEDRRRAEPVLERVRKFVGDARSKREGILRTIDPGLAARYHGLMQRGRLAFIVPVRDDRCSGCLERIPGEAIDRLKQPGAMAVCPRCERMLYGRGPHA